MPLRALPQLPSLLANGNAKYTYVMTYTSVWDPEKKRAKRVSSKKVGKIMCQPGSRDGPVRFDQDFLAENPELEGFTVWHENKKFVIKPTQPDAKELEWIRKAVYLQAGATWALDRIIENTPLAKTISEVFSDSGRGLKILSLAYFLVLNPEQSIHGYEPFCQSTLLPFGGRMDDPEIEKLFASITEEETEDFFTLLSDLCAREYGNGFFEDKFPAFDCSAPARQSDSAWFSGCAPRDCLDLAPVNAVMHLSPKTLLPLGFTVCDGTVSDIPALFKSKDDLTGFDFPSQVITVADTVYPPDASADDCLHNSSGFLFDLSVACAWIKKAIDDNREKFSDLNCYDLYLERFAVTVKLALKATRFKAAGNDAEQRSTREIFLHLYFNSSCHEEERQALTDCVAKAREKYREGAELSETAQRYFDAYCSVDEETNTVSVNNDRVNEALKYSGFSALVSDCVPDAMEAYLIFYERNEASFAFNTLRKRLRCEIGRLSDQKTITGKCLIQFIACAVAALVRRRMKDYSKNLKKFKDSREYGSYRLTAYSDGRVLSLLNTVMATELNGSLIFNDADNKKKWLFNALGVSVPTGPMKYRAALRRDGGDIEEPESADAPDDDLIY